MVKINRIRVLILSDSIYKNNKKTEWHYEPTEDIHLDIGEINQEIDFSVFDYDVTIIHLCKPSGSTKGYFYNLPKIYRDAKKALEHSRTIICLPGSEEFITEPHENYVANTQWSYSWIRWLGIGLENNVGENIVPSGAGQARVIAKYLECVEKYYQVVTHPDPTPASTLAIVEGTNIVVGIQHLEGTGTVVVLPPPLMTEQDQYMLSMSCLMDVARRYYDRAQRRIAIEDVPDWLSEMLPSSVRSIQQEIEILESKKSKYDLIAYATYGTGKQLEDAIMLLLTDLGLVVESQPKGANIDLKAKHELTGFGFAIEVTGTRGIIQKDSDKIAQSWPYLSERAGTPEEQYRLIIAANTQQHLPPKQRQLHGYSETAAKLLGGNGVLLMTTLQLYALWKDVEEKRANAIDIVTKLHKSFGLFSL